MAIFKSEENENQCFPRNFDLDTGLWYVRLTVARI